MATDVETVRQGVKEALTEQPILDYATVLINHGFGFTVSDRFNDIANGDSIFLFVENPSDSGFEYDIILFPRASGLADLDVSFNATEDAEGTDIDVDNLRDGVSRGFSGIARETQTGDTGSYTHGDTFIEDIVPGSSGGIRMGGQVVGGIGFTIDQGSNKLIELRNEAGSQITRAAINAVILETTDEFKSLPKRFIP